MKFKKRWHEVLWETCWDSPVTSRDLKCYQYGEIHLSQASNILRQLWVWGLLKRNKKKDVPGRHGIIYEYTLTKKGYKKLVYHGYMKGVKLVYRYWS